MKIVKNVVLVLIAITIGIVIGNEVGTNDSIKLVTSSLGDNLEEYTIDEGMSVVFFEQNDKITGFICIGNPDYNEYGLDIVNAGISSVVLNTVGGISAFTNAQFRYENGTEPDVYVVFEIQQYNSLYEDEIQILLQSLRLSIEQISSTYGSEYVSVKTIN